MDTEVPVAVFNAIYEFDEFGEEDFLAKYDLNPPRTTFIRFKGQDYPAKAIWLAAHANLGRKTRNHTSIIEGKLKALGFEVVKPEDGPIRKAHRPTPEERYFEGKPYQVELKVLRRNRDVVEKVKARDKYTCRACKFNFETRYGTAMGKGLIEVHHLIPLHTYDGEHEVREKELVALCANCHRVAHRRNPPYTVEEIQEQLGKIPTRKNMVARPQDA